MIKRKLLVEEKQEKQKEPRKKKLKVDLTKFPDAIVDGKFVVPVKGKVFFERLMGGSTKIHEGTVSNIYENGIIELFDETVEQFYAFDLKQKLPVIKVG